MDTNIKILIGVVVLIILVVIGFLIFKHRENFNNYDSTTPAENFYKYLQHLYYAINRTIIPDFHNSDRTVDITNCDPADNTWPPAIQNHTTINHLNKAYNTFKTQYKDDIAKVIELYLSTDTVTYTAKYNKLANTLINMSIEDPLVINLTRLNGHIVISANPNIPKELYKKYGTTYTNLENFVKTITPM
jgi:hypothetical protein